MGALISIAGIITPLGLYQALLPDGNVQTPFQYLVDSSPFGYGTPPRSNFTFNRLCTDLGFEPRPCPFTDSVMVRTDYPNGTVNWHYPYGIDLEIPKTISDAFSSGTSDNTTVSNFFDIQWRRHITTIDANMNLNNGSEYLTGEFRSIQSLAMDNSKLAVEGLIVDAEKGSIGFRNHTIPPGFKHGVTWVEDLLFIEPETVCVNTNITIDFTISSANNTLVDNVVLTDRGGFSNFNHSAPILALPNAQKNPELYGRAYQAAWLQNVYTMLWFNVTNPADKTTGTKAFSYVNSEVGSTFPVVLNQLTTTKNFDSLDISGVFGNYLANIDSGSGVVTNLSDPTSNINPFGISSDNFTVISMLFLL